MIAFEAIGSKAGVSYAYLCASVIALVVTLNIGRLEQKLTRRWLVTTSMILLAGAATLFALAEGPLFAVAISLLAAQTGIFSVCVSLYVLENIERRHVSINEAERLLRSGWAWTIGPIVAVILLTTYGRVAPMTLAIGFCGATLYFFWKIRLGPTPTFSPRAKPPSPFKNIPRFFSQRRLRIVYGITVARGLFWSALFIYAPIYVIEAGLPAWIAGLLLSSVAALLMFSPRVLRAAGRYGTRTVITSGFCVLGASLLGLAIIGDAHPAGIGLWILAAAGASAIDVLNNVPFMRIVRSRERTEMTTVFSTWRELTALLAPLLGAVVIATAPFWTYYLLLATIAFAAAIASTYLPRRI